MSGPLLLAVESSCDETGIALVEGGRTIHSNVVASQVALHAASGGIVPEVAARAHLRWIVPVLDAALADAGLGWAEIDGVAVTRGPGLAGSLLVGINFAKALAFVHDLPLVGVNHLEGHIYAAWLQPQEAPEARQPVFPLVAPRRVGRPHVPRRDARPPDVPPAGPDGRRRSRRSVRQGRAAAGPRLPGRAGDHAFRGHGDRSLDRLSAGLAGGLLRLQLQRPQDRVAPADRRRAGRRGAGRRDPDAPLSEGRQAALAYGFQESVVDVLVTKTIRAAEAVGARSIVLGGGVAANRVLRERLAGEAEARRIPLIVPPPALCTDNGAMIGAAAARRFEAGERSGLDLDARPSLPLALPVAA